MAYPCAVRIKPLLCRIHIALQILLYVVIDIYIKFDYNDM